MNNSLKDQTILYTKDSCCGCGGCSYVCPQKAITMEIDEKGNEFPNIDREKCVSCKLCIQKCAFQNEKKYLEPYEGYAVVNNNQEQLCKSASGGAFSAIASHFIKGFNHFVCGSIMDYSSRICAKHVLVNDSLELEDIYGSKYVQSSLLEAYSEIETKLKKGANILFSGTPCQVAQIKSMFGNYSKQLYTIDIICHGTPSRNVFSAYIDLLEKRNQGKVIDFKFRDKSYGWGKFGSYVIEREDRKEKIDLPQHKSSYYTYFMEGNLQRENCFNCPYSSSKRVSDLTIGDFWGIEKYEPNILKTNGGILDETKGISAVLVNSEKGKLLLEGIDATLLLVKIDEIVLGNSQLRHTPPRGKLYNKVKSKYSRDNYLAIEKIYNFDCIRKKIRYIVKKIINF